MTRNSSQVRFNERNDAGSVQQGPDRLRKKGTKQNSSITFEERNHDTQEVQLQQRPPPAPVSEMNTTKFDTFQGTLPKEKITTLLSPALRTSRIKVLAHLQR